MFDVLFSLSSNRQNFIKHSVFATFMFNRFIRTADIHTLVFLEGGNYAKTSKNIQNTCKYTGVPMQLPKRKYCMFGHMVAQNISKPSMLTGFFERLSCQDFSNIVVSSCCELFPTFQGILWWLETLGVPGKHRTGVKPVNLKPCRCPVGNPIIELN